jgi:N6-L-threonylcarbamoyladenine synthase
VKILGIETSCDETAAAVVEDGYYLLSNAVASSMDLHIQYGGVVPEIAARSHIEVIMPIIDEALAKAQCGWDEIDAIAVTYGAGLSGSLLIGVLTARTLAIAHAKPLYAINHVAAHVYANFLTKTDLPGYAMRNKAPDFPMLAVIVSGGHSQLVLFRNHFDYTMLGYTQDDAVGEAFDKVAKILGLPYPGGPSVAVLRLAQSQIGQDYTFPSIKLSERLNEAQKADIAASFQRIAFETIVDKVKLAYDEFTPHSVVLAGGVAASTELRRQLSAALPCSIEYPDLKLCTDNGAMIATLGCYMAKLGQPPADPYSLDIAPNLSM